MRAVRWTRCRRSGSRKRRGRSPAESCIMRRSSSVSVHSSSGSGSPSASSESTARAMRARLGRVDRLEEAVALEARDVGHRLADGVERDLALRAAAGRASRPPASRRGGCPRRGRPATRASRRSRAAAARARRSASHCGSSSREMALRLDHRARVLERPEPRGLQLLPLELRQHHEHDRVLGQARAERLEGLAALGAGLAGGDADLDELPRGEEREVGGRGAELRPVGAGLGDEHLALGAASRRARPRGWRRPPRARGAPPRRARRRAARAPSSGAGRAGAWRSSSGRGVARTTAMRRRMRVGGLGAHVVEEVAAPRLPSRAAPSRSR